MHSIYKDFDKIPPTDMILNRLSITNFKNIAEASLDFSHNINGFLGRNGMGKSNLLDAIYYLSFCKSFSGVADMGLIRRGDTFTMLKAAYDRRGQAEELTLGLAHGKRKSFKRQGKEYRRMSQHIGAFPLVLVSPRDMELVNGASEERRRFIDMIISQTDSRYLDHLIRYNNALQQRGRLLRDGSGDSALYEAIETAMGISAGYITERRRDTVAGFMPIFRKHYRDIAQSDESPGMEYVSQIIRDGEPLEILLERSRRRDMILGYTTVGPHRDDIGLTLDGMPAKTTASQGQSKTFTIAMRLSQYEFLDHAVGLRPLLLLDDIFDKLDAGRVSNIVDIVNRDIFGQIFITDTNRENLDTIMASSGADYRLWEVSGGCFTPAGGQL